MTIGEFLRGGGAEYLYWVCGIFLLWVGGWFVLVYRNLWEGRITLMELFALVFFVALALFSVSLLGPPTR